MAWTLRERSSRALAIVVAVCLLAGCSASRGGKHTASKLPKGEVVAAPKSPLVLFPDRFSEGYTLVLPGAWGDLTSDYGILKGLEDADVRSAVELHDWTTIPMRIAYNIRNTEHNRDEAQSVAAKIAQYQDHYPGRPVHLIGYSGGAGILVQALEFLPADRKVTRAVLLAPDISSDYDLRPALSRTEQGIHNFYSPFDVTVLMLMGTAVGTTDGRHTLAGGAIGFYPPKSLDKTERKEYHARVTQKQYVPGMLRHGHTGGHFGWTGRSFVASRVAPMLKRPPVERLPHLDPTQEAPVESLAGPSKANSSHPDVSATDAAPTAFGGTDRGVIRAAHAGD